MSAPRGVAAVLVAILVSAAALSAGAMPGYAAAVPWPASADLVLAEAVTGGASASDEYVEIYNASNAARDLGGCELIYVTASGATTTRKALFSALLLAPGEHLLVANSAGIYGPLADMTYTGGLAADGGTLAVRHVGGTVIDALSWGTASNSFVEGAAAPAPPAGSSLERRPGSGSGNWVDTNDNGSDWIVRSNPIPQSLGSAPVPAPATPPAQTGTPTSAAPTPSNEPPDPSSSGPTAEPTAAPTAPPTAEPTTAPGSFSPAPTEPDVDVESIAAARAQAAGTVVHLAGVVTVPIGPVGADDLFAIADSSGGIFVRVAAATEGLDIGRSIDLAGVLSAPYGQLEVRELKWLRLGAPDFAPAPIGAALPEIGERLEGSLVAVKGTIDSVTTESGRLAIGLSDGQTEVRVLADPMSGVVKADVARGQRVGFTGIVGQRATATGRLDGYRLWLRMRSDVTTVPIISAGSTPSPSPAPTARPRATATPTPVYRDLATGLAARGRVVDVEATVSAAVGIIDWGGPTIVVDDGTAAVAVVLPVGVASPRIGAGVHVVGKTGSLHSGPRVVATIVEASGDAVAIAPRELSGVLGPEHEWRLVSARGRVTRLTRAGSRWRADLAVDGQTVAVLGEPGAGISPAGLMPGRLVLATGIVRRSTSDSGVFQLLPRTGADLILGPAPAATGRSAGDAISGQAGGTGASAATAAPAASLVAVSDIPGHEGETVSVAGLIVDPAPDDGADGAPDAAAGSTALLDDGTGRVHLGGSGASDAISLLEPGDAVEVTGVVARVAGDWLIEVDPDRIVALGGAGPGGDSGRGAQSGAGAAGASAGSGAGASASAGDPTASDASGVGDASRGQAHGLAHPTSASGGPDPIVLVGMLSGLLLLALAGVVTAWAARSGRLRPVRRRPADVARRAREALGALRK